MTDQTVTDTAASAHRSGITTERMCDLCARKGVETRVITAETRRSIAPKECNPFLTGSAVHGCYLYLPHVDRKRRLCWLFNNADKDWNMCTDCFDRMADRMAAMMAQHAAAEECADSTDADDSSTYVYGYEGGVE